MAKDRYSRLELTLYVVGWTLILAIPLIGQTYSLLTGSVEAYDWHPCLHHWQLMLPIVALFALNNWVLLPRLFWQQRKTWYFLTLIVLFVVLWLIQQPPTPPAFAEGAERAARHVAERGREPRPHRMVEMFHITNLIFEMCVLLANFGIKLYLQSLRRDMEMLSLQNEKMAQELQSLKYQISPHFLMNTLNNIQALIDTDAERANKTLQQLSKMMRYQLYDNTSHSVPLRKELDFMRNFIALMRIRYPESVRIEVDFPDEDRGICVPPLLFISFIENAFKYGVSYTSESVISVSLTIKDNDLLFRCTNYIATDSPTPTQSSGIGIKNVRRRLDLIYGSHYDLNIAQTDGMHVVEVRLENRV